LAKDNKPSFFIAGKHLKKDDWCPSKSKSYYATTYDKKMMLRDIDEVDFYMGSMEVYDRGKQQCIKIHTGHKLGDMTL
jgi:hypothetical protein